jgi:hypothetical protein
MKKTTTFNYNLTRFVKTLKTSLLIFILFLSNTVFAYTYRIQEASVNPNCEGYYCVRTNGFCISPLIQYSYPGNINRSLPGAPQLCYSYSGTIPDEISFINISACNPGSFKVPLTGVATSVSCDCHLGLPPAMHNFSATIQPDPLGTCDYLITVFY